MKTVWKFKTVACKQMGQKAYNKNMYKLRDVKGESMGLEATDSKEVYLPSFSITEKDLPEIKQWSVGKKYKLEIEVEMVSSSKNEYGKTPLTARFKIHRIGTEEEDESVTMAKKGHY